MALDVWKYCTTGNGAKSVTTVGISMMPEWYAANSVTNMLLELLNMKKFLMIQYQYG
jgi:hypothetical protein